MPSQMLPSNAELLRWIAENLLGWEYTPVSTHFGDAYFFKKYQAECSEKDLYERLQSWHGIGLVVEEMERRGWAFELSVVEHTAAARFYRRLSLESHHAYQDAPWFAAVFAAARKAMEG